MYLSEKKNNIVNKKHLLARETGIINFLYTYFLYEPG